MNTQETESARIYSMSEDKTIKIVDDAAAVVDDDDVRRENLRWSGSTNVTPNVRCGVYALFVAW